MKITVDKKHFLRALTQVARAVPGGKPALPITGCIYLGAIAAADGKPARSMAAATCIARSVRCRVDARVEAAGRAAVPAATLLALTKSLPDGEIGIAADQAGRVTLSAGRTKAVIVGQNPADFPRVVAAQGEGVALCRVKSHTLLQALAQTRHAAADSGRENMHGVFLGRGEAMAIDGNRAVSMTLDWGEVSPVGAAGVLLPAAALGMIEDLCKAGNEIDFGAGKGWIFGRGPDCEIAIKQQEVPFPVSTRDVIRIAAEGVRHWLTVSRSELLDVLNRIDAVAHGGAGWPAVKLGMARDRLTLRFTGLAGAVDDDVVASWAPTAAAPDLPGPGFSSGAAEATVAVKYLREHLGAALGQADVAVGFGTMALDPVVIQPVVPGDGAKRRITDWTGIIMPLETTP